MRRNVLILVAVLSLLCVGAAVEAQCTPANITATILNQQVPIGTDLVIDYVTPVAMNGQCVYTLFSLYQGVTMIEYGFCLPLAQPINLLGYSLVTDGKSHFRFPVPKDPYLIGVKVHLAGMVAGGTKPKTGTSNGVLAHFRPEDIPLP